MRKLSILCPSRSRVAGAKQLAESSQKQATHPDRVEVLLYVDDDDPELSTYTKEFPVGGCARLIVGEPMSVSKSWNILAEACIGDVLIMGNDDVVYKTPGWDTLLDEAIDKFPDEVYCIWFNDAINGGRHCAFPIVSRRWYEALGYFTPGVFEFGYNDTWIMDVAKRVGDCCLYLDHIHAQHLHGTAHKVFRDATFYRNRQARDNKWARDRAVFQSTDKDRDKDAEILKDIRRQSA